MFANAKTICTVVLPIVIMALVNGVLVPFLVEESAIFKGEVSENTASRR
jgi:hypothetical protein